jgi:hypothetical protein
MNEKTRTIGYICPKCRQPVIVKRTVFSLCASKSEVVCPCGKSILTIQPEETEFRLSVPCAFCKKEHSAVVPERAFLSQPAISMACPASGLDACYIGEEEPVFAAMKRLEEAMDQVDAQEEKEQEEEADEAPHQPGTFLNDLVMTEVLGELKDIAARGGISCQCGSKEWRMRIHYSSLELVCVGCGGSLRIPAATQSDLTDLCCKDRLTIHQA